MKASLASALAIEVMRLASPAASHDRRSMSPWASRAAPSPCGSRPHGNDRLAGAASQRCRLLHRIAVPFAPAHYTELGGVPTVRANALVASVKAEALVSGPKIEQPAPLEEDAAPLPLAA